MALSLAELLTEPTVDQINANVLATLQSKGFPTTDWEAGGVEKTLVQATAQAIFDESASAIPVIAGGGFVDYANSPWLTLLAAQLYLLDRNLASPTIGKMTLSCDGLNGPYTITANQLWAVGPGGNRYNNITGGTLNTGGTLELQWQSEGPNNSLAVPPVNYTDASGTITKLATPLPGVTINNPAPSYSPVVETGISSGVVTPSGTPTGSHSVTIRIDQAGQTGIATWSYSVDGGPYVSAGAVSALSNLGGFGIIVTLTNGGANPSFLPGDTYAFSTPGSWITSQGTDEETNPNLQSRCKNRWPSLSDTPVLGVYDLMARKGSAQVTQTLVIQDPVINDQVNIIIAGQAGVLPSGVVTAVQDYIDPRVPITDRPVVQSPQTLDIVLSGVTITVKAALLATAQPIAQATLQTYFNGLGINGVVRPAAIVELLMEIEGVVDVDLTTFQVNGQEGDLTLPQPSIAGSYQVTSWSQVVEIDFAWISV